MTEPRIKTSIRVSAHIRRAEAGGAFAAIVRRGDPDAGAVAVKLYRGRGDAQMFIQSRDLDGQTVWRDPLDGRVSEAGDDIEAAIDQWLAREISIDPDLWVIEIENPKGDAFLGD